MSIVLSENFRALFYAPFYAASATGAFRDQAAHVKQRLHRRIFLVLGIGSTKFARKSASPPTKITRLPAFTSSGVLSITSRPPITI